MSEVFLLLLNKSIIAGWIVLAVLVLRLLLRRAPRWITCLLWGVAGLRLLLPFSVESVMSLIPSKQPIPVDIVVTPVPSVSTGVPLLNNTVNPILAETFAPGVGDSVNPMQILVAIAAWVWCVGMIGILLYGAISYWRIRRRVRVSLRQSGVIYLCDDIDTPFIFGIFKPRVYLPSGLDDQTVAAVIAHEQAHLRRRDHWIKPLAFLLLAVYWFHPLVWVAYILLCRDIEAACDEKVIKGMDSVARKAYSTALVQCSSHRRTVMACPLAFGEVGVKARVTAVLNYKKPAFWIVLAAVIASTAVAVCFLTDPKDDPVQGIGSQKSFGDVTLTIVQADLTTPDPCITVRWQNRTAEAIVYGEPFTLYYKDGETWENCAMSDAVWTMPAYYVRAGGTGEKTYSLVGQRMAQAGEYRLNATYTVGNRQEVASVDFTITHGVESGRLYAFEPVELVYGNGMYSYVQHADVAPSWQLVNDRQLYEIATDGVVHPLGVTESIELNEDTWDSRLKGVVAWGTEKKPSIAAIRKNNQRAWQVHGSDKSLYVLLEQKDGSFYMGCGSYDLSLTTQPNPDNSSIRWLYRLESVEGGWDISQPAVDGAIYFYGAPTKEHDVPVFDAYYQADDATVEALMIVLEEQSWVYDGIVDRTQFRLDGQMRYQDKWLYFGYQDKVVLYGEYFCTVSDEIVALLQQMQEKAI